MSKATPPRRPGPPTAFDADKALKAAMFVFWRKGFDGAPSSELTRAMGINRPSLYATFGDKESLFGRGASRQDLYWVVDLALAFWPQPNAKARRRKPAAPRRTSIRADRRDNGGDSASEGRTTHVPAGFSLQILRRRTCD